jgi:glycosyltransferase involved in cell wall biosynthesis
MESGAIVIKHGKNKGLGAALRTGFSTALKDNCDIIVTLDADGQHDPNEIRKLISPILEGRADLVLGSRFLGSYEEMEMLRLIGAKAMALLLTLITGVRITDSSSGFRAIHIKALREISLKANYTITHEIIIRGSRKKLRIVEVPINVRRRLHGNSYVRFLDYAIRSSLIIFRTLIDKM